MKEFKAKKQNEILIKGARLLDPGSKLDKVADMLLRQGKIAGIGQGFPSENADVLDVGGCVVFPGFFDLHAHLREPGFEDQETIASGCAAAIAGGFTGLCTMPDTEPVTDTRGVVEFIQRAAEKTMVDISPAAAITKDCCGAELAEMAELVQAGAVAFSDAPHSLANAGLLRHALDYACMFKVPVIDVCEHAGLAGDGLMHEGAMSTRLGMRGIPGIAEDIIISRDLHLAEYTGAAMHLAKISTKRAVELIRDAKKRGVKVTCDVTPHHCLLAEESLAHYNTDFKVKPPLRTVADREALIKGLRDGTIDAIATDHTPHSPEEKQVEILAAPFGTTGLETAFSALYSGLVQSGRLPLEILLQKISVAPRKILHLTVPALREGAPANFSIWDLQAQRQVTADSFYSRSRNSIFLNDTLQGVIKAVCNKGQIWQA